MTHYADLAWHGERMSDDDDVCAGLVYT